MSGMNDGGPAFAKPQVFARLDELLRFVHSPGMSLRDWFAGQAMGGYLAACSDTDTDFPTDEALAAWCYEAADAMLAERQKGGST